MFQIIDKLICFSYNMQGVKRAKTDYTNEVKSNTFTTDIEKQIELRMMNEQKEKNKFDIAEKEAVDVLVYLLKQKSKKENVNFYKGLIGLPKIFAEYCIRQRNKNLLKLRNEQMIKFYDDFKDKQKINLKSKRKCTINIEYDYNDEENHQNFIIKTTNKRTKRKTKKNKINK